MATVYVLKNKQGLAFRIVLSGRKLLTAEGEEPIVQTFPTAEAAQEHLERVLALRKRGGFVIESQGELDERAAVTNTDPLAGWVAWDAATKRLKVTFKGDQLPARRCDEIMERIEQHQPNSVHIICDGLSPGKAWTTALQHQTFRSVRAFICDTPFQTIARQRRNDIGDIGALLGAFPALEKLFVTGAISLSPTTHSTLTQLHIVGDPLKESVLKALGSCDFPELETLAIGMSHEMGPVDEGPAVAALRAIQAPKLRIVAVDGIQVPEFLDAIAATPLPAAWTTLYATGVLEDDGSLIQVLTKHAAILDKLDEVALAIDELDEETVDEANVLVSGVIDVDELDEQLTPATYEEW